MDGCPLTFTRSTRHGFSRETSSSESSICGYLGYMLNLRSMPGFLWLPGNLEVNDLVQILGVACAVGAGSVSPSHKSSGFRTEMLIRVFDSVCFLVVRVR